MKGIRKILVLSMAAVMLMTMVGVGASAVESEETPNLVAGGTFEEFPGTVPAGWIEYTTNYRNDFSKLIATDEGRGNYLNLESVSEWIVYNLKGLEQTESYELSFLYNAPNGTAKVEAKLSYGAEGVMYRDKVISKELSATNGWQEFKARFIYNNVDQDGDEHIAISLYGGAATVSYDNICVRKLTEEEKADKVPTGNMEAVTNGMVDGFTAVSGTVAASNEQAASGGYSLKASGTTNAEWCYDKVILEPGNYKMSFRMKGGRIGFIPGMCTKVWDEWGTLESPAVTWYNFPSFCGKFHVAPYAYADGGADVWQEQNIYFTVGENGYDGSLRFVAYAGDLTDTSNKFNAVYMDDLTIVPEAASVALYNKYSKYASDGITEYGYERLASLSEAATEKTVIRGYVPSVKTGEAPVLLACFYKTVNNENSLVDVQVISSEAATADGHMFLEGAVTVPTGAEYAKTLLWNSASGLMPLCKTFRIN